MTDKFKFGDLVTRLVCDEHLGPFEVYCFLGPSRKTGLVRIRKWDHRRRSWSRNNTVFQGSHLKTAPESWPAVRAAKKAGVSSLGGLP